MVALSSSSIIRRRFTVLNSLLFFNFNPNPDPILRFQSLRFFSDKSWLSLRGKPTMNWPSDLGASENRPPELDSNSNPNPNFSDGSNLSKSEFSAISDLFTNPRVTAGSSLNAELDRAGIEPSLGLLRAVFDHFDSSPKLVYSLFRWAVKRPEFRCSAELFSSMINVLGKAREFDLAWSLILDGIMKEGESCLVSEDTFVILIRRYSRTGMVKDAIRTYEFARDSTAILDSSSEMRLFEILLDSLCKEGKVRAASEYCGWRRKLDELWVPGIRVYNILLNGWFRSRKLKQAEQLWMKMKTRNVKPTVVTYGTLVEGYCQMRLEERAIELVNEMSAAGIEPNAIVYNPIIDALAEAGKFKEAFGMMKQFSVLESGPTISTYNSLVKGFCKVGVLTGASKILKTMIERGFIPTPTTYNYFFRYFSKLRKVKEGMKLYTTMIESGHAPDRLTYHLLLKMLCKDGELDLAVQVRKEMRSRGCDMDLATSTMMIHLYCKMRKYEGAYAEFEDLIRRGIVPQYFTFRMMTHKLRERGLIDMAQKLGELMSSVPHSTKLPARFVRYTDAPLSRRSTIFRKAEAMCDVKNL